MEKQRGRPRKEDTHMMTEDVLNQALVTEEKSVITTFEEATEGVEVGEYRLKKGYGKHYLNSQKECRIKEKHMSRVVMEGDVLQCPPYKLDGIRDKFERIDAPDTNSVDVEVREKPKAPPTMHQKGRGKYDVMYDGIKINDVFLSKKEAQDLIQSYAK